MRAPAAPPPPPPPPRPPPAVIGVGGRCKLPNLHSPHEAFPAFISSCPAAAWVQRGGAEDLRSCRPVCSPASSLLSSRQDANSTSPFLFYLEQVDLSPKRLMGQRLCGLLGFFCFCFCFFLHFSPSGSDSAACCVTWFFWPIFKFFFWFEDFSGAARKRRYIAYI